MRIIVNWRKGGVVVAVIDPVLLVLTFYGIGEERQLCYFTIN